MHILPRRRSSIAFCLLMSWAIVPLHELPYGPGDGPCGEELHGAVAVLGAAPFIGDAGGSPDPRGPRGERGRPATPGASRGGFLPSGPLDPPTALAAARMDSPAPRPSRRCPWARRTGHADHEPDPFSLS